VGKADYQARGVMYVPENARFGYLKTLPEGSDLGTALNRAMETIEAENPDLQGVLPHDYGRLGNPTLAELLRLIGSIPDDIEGDAFGKIYEYFLGNFAMTEGQRGGEFFTPISIVKLIVDIIEPFSGRILDPACGSGGMFVQSARFVAEHKRNPTAVLSIYGQQRVDETIRLAKMNLAVHGLSGDIRPSNTYYEDPHHSVGAFDFVMANPPFNVNSIDKERLKDDKRFPFGIPSVDNRHVREELTEEELAIFDLLTKPDPTLTKAEEAKVKKVVRGLLAKLKSELLVLDWNKRQATRAAVQLGIETELDAGLPEVYDRAIYDRKASAVFEHIFASYRGAGHSVYAAA